MLLIHQHRHSSLATGLNSRLQHPDSKRKSCSEIFLLTDGLNTDLLTRQPSPQIPPPTEPKPAESILHIPGDLSGGLGCDDVRAHLSKHLRTPILDELYQQLWLVARQPGASIDPLHAQNVKGRTILPTEDPNLHLVWNCDKIHVKPVPAFLLNHDFWLIYLRVTSRSPSPHVRFPTAQLHLVSCDYIPSSYRPPLISR